MNPTENAVEEGRRQDRDQPLPEAQARTRCQFERICGDSLSSLPLTHRQPAPSHAAIPQTSPERLARAAADDDAATAEKEQTVLYLAYGSNLSAETFRGTRGIEPLSQINVCAPAFELTFDLPGIPYQEPCFANTAPRKVPRLPPNMPNMPDLPPVPRDATNPPASYSSRSEDGIGAEREAYVDADVRPRGCGAGGVEAHRGKPTWAKGLYGVVYEVTREDYATIIRTEGGGASYRDVQTLCFPLPPALHVPEKPAVPGLPKPFLAHTLYAPRVPDATRRAEDGGSDDGDDDGDDDDDACLHRLRKALLKLALPVRRPDASYAQPSARYLKLIRDGAAEHDLPEEYQSYLAQLQPYTITTRRQEIGRLLFLAAWAPLLLAVFCLSRLLADNVEGRAPRWVAVAMAVVMNLMWVSHDAVFKPLFGDGERTEERDDGDVMSIGRRRRGRSAWSDEENSLMLVDKF
ncbi:hypothetical protein DL764_004745 [Monosporascus ibericus]|uniref:gamma-glutamylcyclotransferase n=1 Tax=Monosporascus ibericus TaxID=155417 RepID=A0A4Q4TE64_9PEZI|nr:hypothetical protein DL764_004745 [Monosporascus ibericus]